VKKTGFCFSWWLLCGSGYEDVAIFDKMSCFISETMQDMAIVAMEDEYTIDQKVPLPVTWSDP